MDILTSVRAVNYIFQAFAMTQLRFNMAEKKLTQSRFLQIYTLLILIVELIITVYGILARNSKSSLPEVSSTVDWIQLIGLRLANITAAVESLTSMKEQEHFFEILQNIDKTIENTFNFKFDHRRVRLKSIIHGLAILSLFLACEFFILRQVLVNTAQVTLSYWFQYFAPLILSGSRYFQIYFYADLINQRIIKVNDFLNEIKLDQAPLPLATVKLFNINANGKQGVGFLRLLTLRELYNSLYKVSNVFNRCFGFSILISVANDFMSLTSNCYWMFLSFENTSSRTEDILKIVGSAIWSIPHLFTVMLIVSVCHRAEQNVSIFRKVSAIL